MTKWYSWRIWVVLSIYAVLLLPVVLQEPHPEDFAPENAWCPGCDWAAMKKRLRCGRFLQTPNRAMLTNQEFEELRMMYEWIVGVDQSTIVSSSSSTTTENYSSWSSSLLIPYTVQYAPDNKGRGLFASQSVRQGTKVLDNQRFEARFPSGDYFKDYLQALTPPQACDILVWFTAKCTLTKERLESETATKKFLKTDTCLHALPMVDLDDAALCNDGHMEYSNIGCPEYHDDDGDDTTNPLRSEIDCSRYTYATKDIQAGDEILCKYGDYALGWDVLEEEFLQSVT